LNICRSPRQLDPVTVSAPLPPYSRHGVVRILIPSLLHGPTRQSTSFPTTTISL
jgi:hypothetical protein